MLTKYCLVLSLQPARSALLIVLSRDAAITSPTACTGKASTTHNVVPIHSDLLQRVRLSIRFGANEKHIPNYMFQTITKANTFHSPASVPLGTLPF